jgi:hypothetical protein
MVNLVEMISRVVLPDEYYIQVPEMDLSRHPAWVGIRSRLEQVPDIEAKASDGRTPLSTAATNGHDVAVEQLLSRGAEFESRDQWGQTPLSRAAENGHENIVKLLLDKGADIEANASDSRAPLLWASENKHDVVVKLLLKKMFIISSYSPALLDTSLSGGHKIVIEYLLANYLDSVAQGDFNWLLDLKDAGFKAADVTSLLLETAKTGR